MLNARLFGQFELRLAEEPLDLSSRPAQTLLAYLLLHRDVAHRRERLAGLLWPDFPESSARKSLRNALWRLRRALGDDYLLTDRSSVAFNTDAPHNLDVAILENKVDKEELDELARVVAVYEGELLPGFYEDWVLLERERLRSLFQHRVQALLDGLAAAGRWREVKDWAEHWIALGHVPEPAYRALMMAHAAVGDSAGVANSYRRCVQALDEELSVSPSAETQELYERLASGELVLATPPEAARLAPPSEAVAPSDAGNLPASPTPFVGRREEVVEIGQLLAHERGCRLLTLVGPGGIGKTRLAIEATRATQFTQGAWFVPLAPLGIDTSLVSAVADALRLRLDGSADAGEQLFAYLRNRELLLVLDNFEHLLSPLSTRDEAGRQGGGALVADLLERAPRVKVLVTSRERLNLRAEWVFNVEGLQVPERLDGQGGQEVASFSAVQLFLQRARQVERSFGQDGEEMACVARICQLVGGMPLAIELAAAWVNVLSCREILQEIERNLDFLSTSLRDYPERHRDIRAVFETSWQMLTGAERRLFRRLSVCRGGFTRAAAEVLGGESAWVGDDLSPPLVQQQPPVLAALAGLVDKSYVRYTPDGRYDIHELMRRYGAAKLIEQPDEEQQARDNHARYHLAFLVQQEAHLIGPRQREVVQRVAMDMENINVAWKWAAAQEKLAAINQTLSSYFNFCLTRSRLREGEAAFAQLVDHLQRANQLREHPLYKVLLGRALIRRAAICYLLGKYDEARQYAEEGLASGLGAAYRSDVAFAQIVLGVVAGWQGDKELAEKWLYRSLATSQEIDDRENMADALHELAQLHSSFGDYREARRLAQQSLDVSRAYGRPDWVAHALVTLGWAVVCLGEYEEAEACYREALGICESLGNQYGAAEALDGLGWVAWCREDFAKAQHYYEQSLAMMRVLGHRRLLANTLCNLAILANEQQDFAKAASISREGLRLAEELDSTVYQAPYLCCMGRACGGAGDYAASRHFLREALRLAYDAALWPSVTFILYEFATLLLNESDAVRPAGQAALQRKSQALELLALIRYHPATWQAVRDRAARLQTRLEAELPEDVVITAKARGKPESPHKLVEELLQTTSGPGPSAYPVERADAQAKAVVAAAEETRDIEA